MRDTWICESGSLRIVPTQKMSHTQFDLHGKFIIYYFFINKDFKTLKSNNKVELILLKNLNRQWNNF